MERIVAVAVALLAAGATPLARAQTTTAAASSPPSPPAGSTHSRLSLPSLLFSLPCLVLGAYFLLAPRRLLRATAALALALASALAAWAVTVNLQGHHGLTDGSDWDDAMAIWGIVAACCAVGLVVGATSKAGFRLGWACIGPEGGLAFAFALLLVANDLTLRNVAARWVVVSICIVAGMLLCWTSRKRGAVVCASLIGAFLLFLGIDLLVNERRGFSQGLAYLVDHPSNHPQGLEHYRPPASTRVFAAAVWIIASVLCPYSVLPPDLRRTHSSLSAIMHLVFFRDRQITNDDPEAAHQLNRADMSGSSRSVSGTSGTINGNRLRKHGDDGLLRDRQHERVATAGTTATSSEIGLSAIAEQTERSQADTESRSMSPLHGHPGVTAAPIGSRFEFERGGRVGVSDPFGSQAAYDTRQRQERRSHNNGEAVAPSSTNGPYQWQLMGLADPNEPATPPATIFSETTVLPDDSASQVGWRRFQAEKLQHQREAEQQEIMNLEIRRDSLSPTGNGTDGEGSRVIPIMMAADTTAITQVSAPPTQLPAPANLQPHSETSGANRHALGDMGVLAVGAAAAAPSPQRSGVTGSVRGFWSSLTRRGRHPSASSTSNMATLQNPSPQPHINHEQPHMSTINETQPATILGTGLGTAPRPETAPTEFTAPTSAARGVLTRLGQTFNQTSAPATTVTPDFSNGQNRTQNHNGFPTPGAESVAMTAPTGPMEPFLTVGHNSHRQSTSPINDSRP